MTSTLNRVERACAELHHDRQAVTFTAVAARTGLGRTTLYRNPPSAPSSKNTDAAPPRTAPSPTRSPPSAPRSTPSPPEYAATKNNSANCTGNTESVNRPTSGNRHY